MKGLAEGAGTTVDHGMLLYGMEPMTTFDPDVPCKVHDELRTTGPSTGGPAGRRTTSAMLCPRSTARFCSMAWCSTVGVPERGHKTLGAHHRPILPPSWPGQAERRRLKQAGKAAAQLGGDVAARDRHPNPRSTSALSIASSPAG